MANVEVYDKDDNFLGTRELQICLQHGFGDGMRTSCRRTVQAVSGLLYNLPISGYLSMRMDAMPILNDSVGGVTVEVLQDLTSAGGRNVSLKKGETVTLTGDEAYVYLRSRDIHQFDSASLRLERQMQYMSAFFEQAGNAFGGDILKVMRMYDAIEDYVVSGIDFAGLAEETMKYGFDPSRMYSISGETVLNGGFEEFHADDTALYELVLKLFYEELD